MIFRDQDNSQRPLRQPLIGAVAAVCATVGMLLAGPAAADVTLTYNQSNSDTEAFEIRIQPPKIRMNEAGGMWMLYDGSIDTMFAIDPKRRKYTRINRDRAAMMGGMMDSVQSQMQEMMKNMTPEQRAMMEQAMGRKMPSAAPKSEFRKTGQSRKLDGKTCEVGQLLVNDQVEHEFCVASPQAVGVGQAEYKVMSQMFELMGALRKAAGSYFNRELPDPRELGGVAIESKSSNGEHHVLKSVSQASLDASLFKLPADYQEEAIPSAP